MGTDASTQEPLLEFRNVSKCFPLHREEQRTLPSLLRRFLPGLRPDPSHHRLFWPLRQVSFTVNRGETVGIVGPNGAGKSTLLKLITGILEPTEGEILVNGRVASLLELGAGFHPDLTGRENIYLNGSIYGLSRQEIRERMPDIIEFAGLGEFIDTPVKHYSSGMYVRLGFAIAVHTEPDLLLVDEVLAVGDAAFQRKSLERLDEFRRQGVTVIFVSHSPEMVRSLSSRAIWLEDGRVWADGPAEMVVARYLAETWASEEESIKQQPEEEEEKEEENPRRWGTGKLVIEGVRLLDETGQERMHFHPGEPLTVEIRYCAKVRIPEPVFGLAIHRTDGVHVTGPNTAFAGCQIPWVEGPGVVRYRVPSLPLLEGSYQISLAAHNREDTEMFDYHDRLYLLRVLAPLAGERYGLMTLQGEWSWNGQGLS